MAWVGRARHKARLEEKWVEALADVSVAGVAAGCSGKVRKHPSTSAVAKGSAPTSAASSKAGAESGSEPSRLPTSSSGTELEDAASDYSEAALDQLLVSYDNRLKRLWEALPPRYMLVVTTGAGDTAEYDRYNLIVGEWCVLS